MFSRLSSSGSTASVEVLCGDVEDVGTEGSVNGDSLPQVVQGWRDLAVEAHPQGILGIQGQPLPLRVQPVITCTLHRSEPSMSLALQLLV